MGAPVGKQSKIKQSFVSPQIETAQKEKQLLKSIIIKGQNQMETIQNVSSQNNYFSDRVDPKQKITPEQNPNILCMDLIKESRMKDNSEYFTCNEDANSKKGFLSDRSDNVPNEDGHNLLASSYSSYNKTQNQKKKWVGDFQASLLSLPEEAFFKIIQFLIDEYFVLISINSLWFLKIKENLESNLLRIDNSFIKEHLDFFQLRNGYNSTKILHSNKKPNNGFRYDRNLVAELLPGFESQTSFKIKLKF
jgi:hypothetical protein